MARNDEMRFSEETKEELTWEQGCWTDHHLAVENLEGKSWNNRDRRPFLSCGDMSVNSFRGELEDASFFRVFSHATLERCSETHLHWSRRHMQEQAFVVALLNVVHTMSPHVECRGNICYPTCVSSLHCLIPRRWEKTLRTRKVQTASTNASIPFK